jgi:hypothetical protein
MTKRPLEPSSPSSSSSDTRICIGKTITPTPVRGLKCITTKQWENAGNPARHVSEHDKTKRRLLTNRLWKKMKEMRLPRAFILFSGGGFMTIACLKNWLHVVQCDHDYRIDSIVRDRLDPPVPFLIDKFMHYFRPALRFTLYCNKCCSYLENLTFLQDIANGMAALYLDPFLEHYSPRFLPHGTLTGFPQFMKVHDPIFLELLCCLWTKTTLSGEDNPSARLEVPTEIVTIIHVMYYRECLLEQSISSGHRLVTMKELMIETEILNKLVSNM